MPSAYLSYSPNPSTYHRHCQVKCRRLHRASMCATSCTSYQAPTPEQLCPVAVEIAIGRLSALRDALPSTWATSIDALTSLLASIELEHPGELSIIYSLILIASRLRQTTLVMQIVMAIADASLAKYPCAPGIAFLLVEWIASLMTSWWQNDDVIWIWLPFSFRKTNLELQENTLACLGHIFSVLTPF